MSLLFVLDRVSLSSSGCPELPEIPLLLPHECRDKVGSTSLGCCLIYLFLDIGSHYVNQAGLEHTENACLLSAVILLIFDTTVHGIVSLSLIIIGIEEGH